MNKPSLFELATQLINSTHRHLFLTGKAGTGKTTFLKHIVQHTHKNFAVVAPTGVAAINAGGVTMHSLLQLPFLPYIPEAGFQTGALEYVDPYSVIKGTKFRKEKIDVIQELELLIIDEVSMLRADMLDAMDAILRHYRNKRDEAFGGVQILFIGDLYQLPPVINDSEWELLRKYYSSPFFFDAHVLKETPPVCIEFQTIFRQNDPEFIHLLNAVRNNEAGEDELLMLNSRAISHIADMPVGGITLSTHNATADAINQRELQALKGIPMTYTATVSGVFNDKAFPAEMSLQLKVGTQVMFVKNDPSPEKNFYNGMLAKIQSLDMDEIVVEIQENGKSLRVTRETWKNVQYKLNEETRKIEEEELGSFVQFPLRLAWAVTIHKSQGLTFNEVCIDASRSFASGQVYVALSRCRTFDGLHLLSRISANAIRTDQRIVDFNSFESDEAIIKSIIDAERPEYEAKLLIKAFDFTKLIFFIHSNIDEFKLRKSIDEFGIEKQLTDIREHASAMQSVSDQFSLLLRQAFAQKEIDYDWLNKKVSAAKQYFYDRMISELILPMRDLCDNLQSKSKYKKVYSNLIILLKLIEKKNDSIINAVYFDMNFGASDLKPFENYQPQNAPTIVKKKQQRGDTYNETFLLYKEGFKVAEIAEKRGFAIGTIETHIGRYIENGELEIHDFNTKEQVNTVCAYLDMGIFSLKELKERLPEEYTFSQIRMIISHWKFRHPGKFPTTPS